LSQTAPTYPLRLRIIHDDFALYDGVGDEMLEGAPSLTELRKEDAVVVLRARKNAAENTSAADADSAAAVGDEDD
jgi:hypothetical protein